MPGPGPVQPRRQPEKDSGRDRRRHAVDPHVPTASTPERRRSDGLSRMTAATTEVGGEQTVGSCVSTVARGLGPGKDERQKVAASRGVHPGGPAGGGSGCSRRQASPGRSAASWPLACPPQLIADPVCEQLWRRPAPCAPRPGPGRMLPLGRLALDVTIRFDPFCGLFVSHLSLFLSLSAGLLSIGSPARAFRGRRFSASPFPLPFPDRHFRAASAQVKGPAGRPERSEKGPRIAAGALLSGAPTH